MQNKNKVKNHELKIMNEVLKNIDNFNSHQLDKLLIIMGQQLSLHTEDEALKKELLDGAEKLTIEVKKAEKDKVNQALNSLRENYENGKKIERNTMKHLDIVKDDIPYTEDEEAFIKWLEDLMTIKKGKPYKIKTIELEDEDEESEIKESFVSISERVKAEGTNDFEMDNSSLEPVLLRAVAQKGLINSYSLANIEQELKDKDITAVLKETIDKKYWNTIDDLVSQINKRYQISIKRQRELY